MYVGSEERRQDYSSSVDLAEARSPVARSPERGSESNVERDDDDDDDDEDEDRSGVDSAYNLCRQSVSTADSVTPACGVLASRHVKARHLLEI
ncbi:hypothetical protein PoB_003008000 [Plakobranchus ocellatus]|uniref:Uncharacterized protein n=1 Tax=Plakobranchus ocellatus TaxID=259542 RepID=A0AAV4A865_9GAST|nr:hypothetical protein PoB_003008000 [Plakobranchus ocellatus]